MVRTKIVNGDIIMKAKTIKKMMSSLIYHLHELSTLPFVHPKGFNVE
jgi:hypothetical protein